MLDQTETRLDRLENHATETQQRLGVVETQLKGIGADLKMVVTAVTTAQAQPRFDWFKFVPAIAALVVIFTATGGVITYIAANVNAATNARQEERLGFLQMRLDRGWFGASEMRIRAPGGAVTPQ